MLSHTPKVVKQILQEWHQLIRFLCSPKDQKIKLNVKNKISTFSSLLLLDLIVALVIVQLINFAEYLSLFKAELSMEDWIHTPTWLYTFLLIVFAPVSEEIIFRLGLSKRFFLFFTRFLNRSKQRIFIKRFTRFWDVIFPYLFYTVSLIFGLVHITNYENEKELYSYALLITGSQTFAGLAMGYLRVRYGFIWGLLLHSLSNLFFLIVFLTGLFGPVPPKGEEWEIPYDRLLGENGLKNHESINLINEYSSDELDAFYSLVFSKGLGIEKEQNFIKRWKEDPKVFLRGCFSTKDSLQVVEIIGTVNDLKLPISIHLVQDSLMANCIITFEPFDTTHDNERSFFDCKVFQNNIDSVALDIYHRVDQQDKNFNISSGLLRLLGLYGNERYNYKLLTKETEGLSTLGKRLLTLNYESAFWSGYSSERFENNFEAHLSRFRQRNQVLKALDSAGTDEKVLWQIKKHGFTVDDRTGRRVLLKHEKDILIQVKGEVSELVKANSQKAVEAIEKIIPLSLGVSFDTSELKTEIIFDVIKEPNQTIGTPTIIYKKNLHWIHDEKLSQERSKVTIKHHPLDTIIKYALPILIYNEVCFFGKSMINYPFTDEGGSLEILPEYAEILKVYYNPAVPTGFPEEDWDYCIRNLE